MSTLSRAMGTESPGAFGERVRVAGAATKRAATRAELASLYEAWDNQERAGSWALADALYKAVAKGVWVERKRAHEALRAALEGRAE